MKKRVFMDMVGSVFNVLINTEHWSEGDIELMAQFGEPEVNVGGEVSYVIDEEDKTKVFGDMYVRVLHGFPYSRGFDSRDYGSYEEAIAAGKAWKELVLGRIDAAVIELRKNVMPLPTEEVFEL